MSVQEMKETLGRHAVVIDAHTHVGISPKFYYQYGYPYALSMEDLAIRMETLGIDHAVVFPFVDSAFYEKNGQAARVAATTKYCRFPYEIENRNLLNEIHDIFPQHSEKMLPFLMFDPSRETERQAAFMQELSEKYPVFGLKTATTYIQAFAKDMESKGRPILEFARQRRLPIVFHSAVHPADPWASVYDIVDFAERHPDIRVCIAHSARFVKPVLDKAARLPNCFVDFSAFIIHCTLALQNSPAVAAADVRFPTDYRDPRSAMMRMAQAYPDTMLWGSDTPFYYWIQKYVAADGSVVQDKLSCSWREEAQLLHGLSVEIKNRIAWQNTLKFIFG